jgi:putative glutathione S-transferase
MSDSSPSQFPDEQGSNGSFQRQEDAFRKWISRDSGAPFSPERDRYHLYVSLACPWASRTVIVRHLKKLEDTVGLTVLDPIRDERGWAFRDGPDYSRDPINDFQFLSEAYKAADPSFAGRFTVPALWDKKTGQIVNNSEDDICRMFNDEFESSGTIDLFPPDISEEQRRLSNFIYEHVNNGVYRAGFATQQSSYDQAFRELFAALDELESRLQVHRYLFGNRIVESDWRLFCTLVRFDAVYHGHFKCNLRRIVDYPNLQGYLMDLYQQPGIAKTVNLDHIKRHYYFTHDDINPTRIVPLGPKLELLTPHGRVHRD